jgi:ribosomal protein S6--L-glutamate ligase
MQPERNTYVTTRLSRRPTLSAMKKPIPNTPTVAFLSTETNCHSFTRFKQEAPELGLRVEWLAPQHFDLLVDSAEPQVFYRSRRFTTPAAFIPRTGSDTTLFARAVIRQMECLTGVAVINVLARQPSDVAKMVRLVGGPPVILKLVSGTHGMGVMLGRDIDEIQASLETVWALNETLLIQEYVRDSAGSDIRVLVVGGRALGAMRRTAKLGRFRANVHQGASVEEYPLDDELEWLALRATESMGLEISGGEATPSSRSTPRRGSRASSGRRGATWRPRSCATCASDSPSGLAQQRVGASLQEQRRHGGDRARSREPPQAHGPRQ